MNDKEPHMFKVGDRPTLVNLEHWPEYENTVCEIISPLKPRKVLVQSTDGPYKVERVAMLFKVRCHDGMILGPRYDQLKPPVQSPDAVKHQEAVI